MIVAIAVPNAKYLRAKYSQIDLVSGKDDAWHEAEKQRALNEMDMAEAQLSKAHDEGWVLWAERSFPEGQGTIYLLIKPDDDIANRGNE